MESMTSVHWMFLLFAATSLTAVISLGLALTSKKENDIEFSKVNKKVVDVGDSSIARINESTALIISETERIRSNLKESYSEALESISKLNSDVEASSEILKSDLKSLKYPLSNLSIKMQISVDFSHANDETLSFLNDYKSYFTEIGSYEKIREMCREERLPRMLILSYESDSILRIINPNAQVNPFFGNGNYDVNFLMKEHNFLKIFLPSAFLFLKSDKTRDFSPNYESDLLYGLLDNVYQKKNIANFNYTIDFSTKNILFNITCENPDLLFSSGKVISFFDSADGVFGLNFEHNLLLNISLNDFRIDFGEVAKVSKSATLLYDDNMRFKSNINQSIYFASAGIFK